MNGPTVGFAQRRAHTPAVIPLTQPLPDCRRGTTTSIDEIPRNIVTLTSPSGGVGLSTLTAMLAWTLTNRQTSCALIDLDVTGGGIDVLLGIEQEPGLCMQDLDAPLGSIDGAALNDELPCWQQVHVLSYSPWRGKQPETWEMRAAIEALTDANGIVLVDAGRGGAFTDLPELLSSPHIVAVELSVLGLARAKAHLDTLAGKGVRRPIIVGMQPRGGPRHGGTVALAEATAYLGGQMVGSVRMDARLCASILAGTGITRISRRNRNLLERLADSVEQATQPDRDQGTE